MHSMLAKKSCVMWSRRLNQTSSANIHFEMWIWFYKLQKKIVTKITPCYPSSLVSSTLQPYFIRFECLKAQPLFPCIVPSPDWTSAAQLKSVAQQIWMQGFKWTKWNITLHWLEAMMLTHWITQVWTNGQRFANNNVDAFKWKWYLVLSHNWLLW